MAGQWTVAGLPCDMWANVIWTDNYCLMHIALRGVSRKQNCKRFFFSFHFSGWAGRPINDSGLLSRFGYHYFSGIYLGIGIGRIREDLFGVAHSVVWGFPLDWTALDLRGIQYIERIPPGIVLRRNTKDNFSIFFSG